MLYPVEIPILADSSVASGALNKTADGHRFEINFEQPMIIPPFARGVTVEVQEASIWWTTPNISNALGNNKLYVEYMAVNYVVTLEDGLYSVDALNIAVNRELTDLTGVNGLIEFTADDATQKVNIRFTVATLQIDFTQADTFRDIVGFNSALVPAAPTTAEENILGDNIANFNTISHYLVNSDLVTDGIRVDGQYRRTLAKVPIDVHPGSQILYRPFVPVRIPAHNLRGTYLDSLRFWLTDQTGAPADTNKEDWSCTVLVKYLIEDGDFR